jgi:uncharacterized protein
VAETAQALGVRQFIILPNNGNVRFSAEQVRQLHPDKEIEVIPTQTVPEGFAALMAFEREADLTTNAHQMRHAIRRVKTGEITRAVRTCHLDGLDIHEGDTIAIHQGRITGVHPDPGIAAHALVDRLIDENDAVISLFRGETQPEEQAERLAAELTGRFPDLEVELHHGGQPHYAYIISIE